MNVTSPKLSTSSALSRKSRTSDQRVPRLKSSELVGFTSALERSSTHFKPSELPKPETHEVNVIRSGTAYVGQDFFEGSVSDIRISMLLPGSQDINMGVASVGLDNGTPRFVDKLSAKPAPPKNTFLGSLKNSNYLKTAQLQGASRGYIKNPMHLRPRMSEHVSRSINLIDINNKDLELLMEKRNILPRRLGTNITANGPRSENFANQSLEFRSNSKKHRKGNSGDTDTNQSPTFKPRKSMFGDMEPNSPGNFDSAQTPSNRSRMMPSVSSFGQKLEIPNKHGTIGDGKPLVSDLVQNSNDFGMFRRMVKSFKQNETVKYKPFVTVDSGKSRKKQLGSIETHWKNLKIRRENFFSKQGELASLVNTMFLREDDKWKFDHEPRKSSISSQEFAPGEALKGKGRQNRSSTMLGNTPSKRNSFQNTRTMLVSNIDTIN